MLRIDLFVFGYRKIEYKEECMPRLANLLIRLSICASLDGSGTLLISERDYNRLSSATEVTGVTVSSPLGLRGIILRNKGRYLSLASLLIVFFLTVITSSMVWDVRISGNENIPDYVIREALEAEGLGVGSFWSSFDKESTQTDLLLTLDSVAWLSINRRGTVAYVEVVEKDGYVGRTDNTDGLYNIVASCDAVIEEVTVKSGVAVVKPGDVVKKGDVLISGIAESPDGIRLVHASGTVLGRATGSLSVFVPRSEMKTFRESLKLSELRLKIFSFSINFLKIYGNRGAACDIIQESESFVLFDKYRLPLGLERTYSARHTETEVEYSDSELTEIARGRLRSSMLSYLGASELLKLRTDGEFTADGYRMWSDIVYIADIGTEELIETD